MSESLAAAVTPINLQNPAARALMERGFTIIEGPCPAESLDRLSTAYDPATCFRTLEPGAPSQGLHVDVQPHTSDWPILGFILMVDAFTSQNGATRFVPGSHLRAHGPDHPDARPAVDQEHEVLACGPRGSLIIFNGSVWHGSSDNRSQRRRRSIQGHFIPRNGNAALDYAARLHADALSRLGSVAKRVLGLPAHLMTVA